MELNNKKTNIFIWALIASVFAFSLGIIFRVSLEHVLPVRVSTIISEWGLAFIVVFAIVDGVHIKMGAGWELLGMVCLPAYVLHRNKVLGENVKLLIVSCAVYFSIVIYLVAMLLYVVAALLFMPLWWN
jgi:hypothetical protein